MNKIAMFFAAQYNRYRLKKVEDEEVLEISDIEELHPTLDLGQFCRSWIPSFLALSSACNKIPSNFSKSITNFVRIALPSSAIEPAFSHSFDIGDLILPTVTIYDQDFIEQPPALNSSSGKLLNLIINDETY